MYRSPIVDRLFRTPPFGQVWLVGFFQEVAFFLLVNLPGRLHQLGITETGIGLAYSGSALAAILLRPFIGRILDAVHRRTVLRVAGVANIAAITVLAFADTTGTALWTAFLAQRVLQILLFTTLLTYCADSLPVHLRTQGLAIFGLSGLIPIATSNLAGDPLISAAGYQGVFLAAAACALTSWALVWRLPLLPVIGQRPRRNFWAVVGQRDMVPLWWITLMFSMGLETLLTFMRTYIDTRQIGTLGTFFAIYGGTAVLARLGGGSRYDHLPHRAVTVAAVLGQAGGLGLVAVAPGAVTLAAGAALLGTAHGIVFPILSSQVIGRARTAERGSAMATFTSVMDIALLGIAPLVGRLIDVTGYTTAFSVVGAMLAVGATVYLVWDRRLTGATAAGVAG